MQNVYIIRADRSLRVVSSKAEIERLSVSACKMVIESIDWCCRTCYPKYLLAQWTENKTPEILSQWMFSESNATFLMESAHTTDVVGLVMIANTRDVLLAYIAPHHLRQGIGTHLLQVAEKTLTPQELHADATLPSLNWYLRQGFHINGPVHVEKGLALDIPLRKLLPQYHA